MVTSINLFNKLREEILTGKLRRGYRLIEAELCKKYKISRTPVRDSLIRLEMCGLVENLPNRGAFVTGLDPQEIEDIFRLRRLYEVQATAWAIERITDDELEELEEIFEFMEFYTMKKDLAKMLTINENFHRKIHEATHNPMLIRTLAQYQDFLYYSHKIEKHSIDEKNYLSDLLKEHGNIFSAFRARNPVEGAKAMEKHLINSEIRRMG